MKITSKMLSIPPYLSTTWENISSLHAKPTGQLLTLVVVLENQVQVEVPGLNQETIDEIFEAHALSKEVAPKNPLEGPFSFQLPINSDKEGGLADLTPTMEHNPAQANLPPIPENVIGRINTIAKAFGLEDLSNFSNPVDGCNCMYCQIARGIGKKEEEEYISDEDLTFRDLWEVEQIEDKLYKVTNSLDQNENYNVFLGTPLGCTCGSKNCEHIQAVLKT